MKITKKKQLPKKTTNTNYNISRGKQPHIHQLAQYHSNNTELLSSYALPQILISARRLAQNLKLIAKVADTWKISKNHQIESIKIILETDLCRISLIAKIAGHLIFVNSVSSQETKTK